MSNYERYRLHYIRTDEALERTLLALGPVAQRREQAEAAEPDPEFFRSLRARLTSRGRDDVPADPGLLLDSREDEKKGRVAPWRQGRGRLLLGAGLSAAAIAAGLVGLILGSRPAQSPGIQRTAFTVPTPRTSDLTRSYPLAEGQGSGGASPLPWVNVADIPSGSGYPAHLHLSAGPLPTKPSMAPAYRLFGPTFDAPRITDIARLLGIDTGVRRSRQPDGIWAYAQRREPPREQSVAVSLKTGELIYHDLNLRSGESAPLPLNSPRNVAVARKWLTRLGWPGASMPVHVAESSQEAELRGFVTLGWVGAGATDTPAAVLMIGQGQHVLAADVRPPIKQVNMVPTKGYSRAWSAVRRGVIPVAVDNMILLPPSKRVDGTGNVRVTGLTEVFTETHGGVLYLVPAYRFQGPVLIRGVKGRWTWFALVPAAR